MSDETKKPTREEIAASMSKVLQQYGIAEFMVILATETDANGCFSSTNAVQMEQRKIVEVLAHLIRDKLTPEMRRLLAVCLEPSVFDVPSKPKTKEYLN